MTRRITIELTLEEYEYILERLKEHLGRMRYNTAPGSVAITTALEHYQNFLKFAPHQEGDNYNERW